MKNKYLSLKNKGLIELSDKDCTKVNGGGWISYALGYLKGLLESSAGVYATNPNVVSATKARIVY